MYGKSNMETYITICKIDSQWEFAVSLRKLKQGLCINLEGWDGEGDGKKIQREGIYVYLWLIHVEVWQKATEFCKVIILQLKNKYTLKKKKGYMYTYSWSTLLYNRNWHNSAKQRHSNKIKQKLFLNCQVALASPPCLWRCIILLSVPCPHWLVYKSLESLHPLARGCDTYIFSGES